MNQQYTELNLFGDALDFLDANINDNMDHLKGTDDHSLEITFKEINSPSLARNGHTSMLSMVYQLKDIARSCLPLHMVRETV